MITYTRRKIEAMAAQKKARERGKVNSKHCIGVASFFIAVGAVQATAEPVSPITAERYSCMAQTRSDTGVTSATYEVDANGTFVSFSGSWWPMGPRASGSARMQVGWIFSPSDPTEVENGWFSGSAAVGTRDAPLMSRSVKFRMEITTHLDDGPRNWAQRGFAGYYRKWKDYAYSTQGVNADWHDLYAMAQGAGHVFIVARDKEGKILSSQRVEFDQLRSAKEEAVRLAGDARAMADNFRENCSFEDPGTIIVT